MKAEWCAPWAGRREATHGRFVISQSTTLAFVFVIFLPGTLCTKLTPNVVVSWADGGEAEHEGGRRRGADHEGGVVRALDGAEGGHSRALRHFTIYDSSIRFL
jgi:hypothetical protein